MLEIKENRTGFKAKLKTVNIVWCLTFYLHLVSLLKTFKINFEQRPKTAHFPTKIDQIGDIFSVIFADDDIFFFLQLTAGVICDK